MAMTANVVAKCAGRTAPTSDRAHLATPQALNKNVIGSCLVEDHAHDLVRRALAQYGNHVFGMLDLCVPAPNQHCVGGRVERIAVSAARRMSLAEVKLSREMVGAGRFELPTPGPPDRCANRAALRSDGGNQALRRGTGKHKSKTAKKEGGRRLASASRWRGFAFAKKRQAGKRREPRGAERATRQKRKRLAAMTDDERIAAQLAR